MRTKKLVRIGVMAKRKTNFYNLNKKRLEIDRLNSSFICLKTYYQDSERYTGWLIKNP